MQLTIPQNRELVGGDILAQTLAHLGITTAFGLHGGHLDAFLVGCQEAGIRLVDTRHETAAVQAAEGYSKVKKEECGVCFFTANSGFGNALPGLSTAYADRSSILCITSSAPQRDADMNVLQGFHDQVVVSKPLTKWTQRVTVPEEIPRLVAYGLRQAMTAPAGPVLLDFPIEVLFSPVVRTKKIAWGSVSSPLPFPPGPHPEAISRAAELLLKAKRPVIITGTGARFLKGDSKWAEFLDDGVAPIPVFNSTKYSAPLPFAHPLRAGNASLLPVLKLLGREGPDLVILAGCRTGMFLGSRSSPAMPKPEEEEGEREGGKGCKYIQIDTDGGEIGRGWPIDVGITSDVRLAFAALADALLLLLGASSSLSLSADKSWITAALSLKTLPMPQESDSEFGPSGSGSGSGMIHPYHATKAVLSSLPAGSIISLDGGECGSWAAQLMEHSRADEFFFACGYLGFLGNGWGYSLGAAVAEDANNNDKNNRLVVNIQGDGSAGFHIAELDTYARHGVRVLTVVMNNHCWGMSNSGQDLVYGEGTTCRPASALSPRMDFAAVARGLGCKAERVSEGGGGTAAIREAVKRLLEEGDGGDGGGGGPALLEVIVDRKPVHPGTVAMVGKTDDEDVVVIPYYDNVDRPRYNKD